MRTLAALLVALLTVLPSQVQAICCPFPCIDDCAIENRGQLNWVVIDRQAETVQLIPNIRVFGQAADFSLIVPTPTEPTLAPASAAIWREATALTAPIRRQRQNSGGGLGCDDGVFRANSPPSVQVAEDAGGVDIVRHESVGNFEATIITATDTGALVGWLEDNDYAISTDDAALFSPYVDRGWFFTAMKLDPNAEMPVVGWDTNVDPVLVTFSAPTFEIPLDLLTINRGDDLPVVVYVVDDHKAALPGFATLYANAVSDGEYTSIAARFPTLSPFIAPGKFVTRLDRTFTTNADMVGSIRVNRAPNADEFRRIINLAPGNAWTFSAEGAVFLLPVWSAWRRRPR